MALLCRLSDEKCAIPLEGTLERPHTCKLYVVWDMMEHEMHDNDVIRSILDVKRSDIAKLKIDVGIFFLAALVLHLSTSPIHRHTLHARRLHTFRHI